MEALIVDKNNELQKKARGGEIAIKGTVEPQVTGEPMAPATPIDDDLVFAGENDAIVTAPRAEPPKRLKE